MIYDTGEQPKKLSWNVGRILQLTAILLIICIVVVGVVWTQIDRRIRGTCGDDIVERANSAISDDVGLMLLRDLDKEIDLKEFRETDVNCQYILAHYHMMAQDSAKATAAVDKIDRLISDGSRLNDKFAEPWSTEEMRRYIDELQKAPDGDVGES